ncbi:MATE efflux family protein [Syntrophobotulus glycolicus DSM 8271]|uniref:Multidrug export protein MepA n=1 Tax=Syntrophobotulus glycolicus (strain DSM 8271 / FlGlyR) TaxID=645991 RepID=F0T1G2_SYNGF|nr:MATE family efflux transporter [Syntrophobotulus glycolicus]ADY56303.1 MATE efflux family protein [Syntrophobotulus glycolicus DSM 8271]
MKRSLEMGSQSIGRLLWEFSLPAVIGMLLYSLYNIVDRIFVGRGVGSIGIAAITVAFPIMIILLAIYVFIGIGSTALISLRLGEQKYEEAEKVAGNGTLMLIILPLLISGIYFLFAERILILFGASPTVLPYALDFTHIIILGSVFGSLGFGMNNFIRAEGNPRFAMMTQVIGALLNAVLNYIFIFKLGLGIKGSALATVCGQLFSTIWVLSYFLSGRSMMKIRLKNLKPQMSILIGIMSIGFAPFAMQIASSAQQVILNNTLMIYGGDKALSAVGIIMSIATLLFMPVIGVSQGAQPLIGYNYGAGQYERVKETLKKAVISGTYIVLAGFLLIHIWPEEIVGLFSKGDVELTQITTHGLLIFLVMLPVIAFQILCSNYFQAVGKPVQSTILSLSRQVLLFIPLLLILPRFWGMNGVWLTAPISDGIAVLLTAALIFAEMRGLPTTSSTTNKIRADQ